jgi:hypothetical protein
MLLKVELNTITPPSWTWIYYVVDISEYGVFIEKDFLTGKVQISLKNSEHW